MIKKLTAFTLAETLIVMGIIGVVAALTVPNLNASTGEKEKVAKVKKIYKDLNDAYGRAVAVYGPVDEWFLKDTTKVAQSTRFGERMLDFLKVSKNCKTGTGCFYSSNYTYDGSNKSDYKAIDNDTSMYKIITTDGTSISVVTNFSDFSYSNYAVSCPGPYCNFGVKIYVDIDGPSKGAHTAGRDLFEFLVDKEYGVLPDGGESFNNPLGANVLSLCFTTGVYCTGWVIETGNMDYLKASATGKCPNGTVLSWTNTSCK